MPSPHLHFSKCSQSFELFLNTSKPRGACVGHEAWLSGSVDDARAVLKQYPSDLMVTYRVSPRVNSPKNKDPALIEPVREASAAEQSGLVTVTRVGNQKHFRANQEAPIFQELRSIVLKTVGLVEPLSAALAQVGPQMRLAVVYGSIAKGTDTALSDVDLLIVSDELTLEQVYAAIAPAEQELARRISPTLYTTEEFPRRRKTGDSFVTKVLTGEHIVLAGDERGIGAAR